MSNSGFLYFFSIALRCCTFVRHTHALIAECATGTGVSSSECAVPAPARAAEVCVGSVGGVNVSVPGGVWPVDIVFV